MIDFIAKRQRQQRLNAIRRLRAWRDRCLSCNNDGRLRFLVTEHCTSIITLYVGGYSGHCAECITNDHYRFSGYGKDDIVALKALVLRLYRHLKRNETP